uniref:mediator of RNA polymerase II transcription subunit 15-like n=1 Tax=Fragaria vesca subsp. vesca TaxID=101020 RepID=UPI0005C85F46|nr:PREDICTED: mediator of RNA polymerase II transcription subunit 15-like [Fragaria vesca subsp. vesca]
MMTSTTCGSEPISMKRSPPSPDDPSSLLGFGYSKLTLPLHHHHHHHQPLLRRCISDPYSPPPPPQTNPFLSAGHSPDLNKTTSSPSPTHFNSSLPPLPPPQQPPTLRRSVSDINPSPAQAFSRSSSSNDMSVETDTDTPNSKRLKRMKGRLKEMSEWCRQLMREEDLEQDEELEIGATQDMPDIDAIRDIPNDTSTEDSSEKEFSESVSVEKKDDSLVIHFRCHCDKAYQFLLNGTDCYYKLL